MTLIELLAWNLAITLGWMALLWLLSIVLRDVSIIDVFWGPGFVVIAAATFALLNAPSPRRWLLMAAVSIWGLRLGLHLARRKFGKPEDYRYQAMRERIGPRFWLASLVVVFGLQAIVMNIVALPIVVGLFDDGPFHAIQILGMAVWSIGFSFESIGDWQLERFKSNPDNARKVMDRGLWAYTRHPNYFGDFLVWWGLFLLSLASMDRTWTVISPLLMSFLLLRVSGVTLLERGLRNRRPGYEEYVARTSAFFPWPPRASSRHE